MICNCAKNNIIKDYKKTIKTKLLEKFLSKKSGGMRRISSFKKKILEWIIINQ